MFPPRLLNANITQVMYKVNQHLDEGMLCYIDKSIWRPFALRSMRSRNMKKILPKVSYDSDADVLTLAGAMSGRIDHARELGNFVVHFTKDDRPLLIEVLEASKIFGGSATPVRKVASLAFA